jgi:GTP-binding protein HflX
VKNKGERQHQKNSAETGSRQARGRAVVLHPVLRGERGLNRASIPSDLSVRKTYPSEASLEEAVGLAKAIQLDVCHSAVQPLSRPRPATLFGAGKVEEYRDIIADAGAELAIIDHALTPVQQRNLEKAWNVKVLDRTGLILEIFGARARTKEGRLQVELAHLLYQRSRLVRTWTHLERQRGGFGFLGGPGETQIEADRRMIGERIDAIRADLEVVRRTRRLNREGRKRVPFPVVALAGYTNAGKSTLFNVLTRSSVQAEDKLFATLDPTMRRIELPGHKVILSDTVGFISNLPTTLVAAFRATLEEVSEADLILHVRDIAAPCSEQQKDDVEMVLGQLGVETGEHAEKIIEVWNKSDLLDDAQRQAFAARLEKAEHAPVMVSAATGEGIAELKVAITERLAAEHVIRTICLGAGQGALLHWLYEHGEVRQRIDRDDGVVELEVRMSAAVFARYEHMVS